MSDKTNPVGTGPIEGGNEVEHEYCWSTVNAKICLCPFDPLLEGPCIGESCSRWVGLCAIPSIDFGLWEMNHGDEAPEDGLEQEPQDSVTAYADKLCEGLGVARAEAEQIMCDAHDLSATGNACHSRVIERVLERYHVNDPTTRKAALIGFVALLGIQQADEEKFEEVRL